MLRAAVTAVHGVPFKPIHLLSGVYAGAIFKPPVLQLSAALVCLLLITGDVETHDFGLFNSGSDSLVG